MANRLKVQITTTRDDHGNVVEMIAYHGAEDFSAPGMSWSCEFRGFVQAMSEGSTPEEKIADAEAKAKEEIKKRVSELGASVLGWKV